MICMIPKVILGVGEIAFLFGDIHVSLKLPFVGNIILRIYLV